MINLNKSLCNKTKILLGFCFSLVLFLHAQGSPPELSATGDQAYCIGSPIKIVTNFTITDLDDTTIDFFYIQISSGYQVGFDRLELSGTHPTISQSWNMNEGKLTLTSSTTPGMLLTELENAVKDVVFVTTATSVITEKLFSLSADDANYLPETDHFYQFISAPNITWKDAKIAAENSTYYDRQGYLATLTSEVEAIFAGKQASGSGWIGGSDEETEGVWKWVTGPDDGTVFWNGAVNGSTPNYAKWNNNEPNDFRGNNSTGEDYAHITDASIGIVGAWNDLPNEGGTGVYAAKGYVVEYGASGDPKLNIVASTRIYIPQITSITEGRICESGITTLSATSDEGIIIWFDSQIGGTELDRGTNFITPTINTTTDYFATVSVNGCTTLPRTKVTASVTQRPQITNISEDVNCGGSADLVANSTSGTVFWYDSLTSTTPIFSGNNFQTPNLTTTTSYFVEASLFGCTSTRKEVVATVDSTIPYFELEQDTYILCSDIGSITLRTINSKGNYTYSWSKENQTISGNTTEISVSEPGLYTVKVFSDAGCKYVEKTIIVKNSEIASITKEDVIIIDDSNNNSMEIIVSNIGIGDYEFSLDNEFGGYSKNNIFENITTGTHTLYVRDIGGCGISSYQFSILEYPRFFTPNEDGINDYWSIRGYDKNVNPLSEIYIYNRFGVLLYKMDASGPGWNGTYEGKKLPSNTYWFKSVFIDNNGLSVEKNGSFSLIRK